jgi:ubiquinone/menaquinone biosynthesis C-methylase UbiE
MVFDSEHDVRGDRMRTAHMFGTFAHADGYDRMTRRKLVKLRERIVAEVAGAGLGPGARVLDVGTGPGRLPLAIAAALPHLRVDGIDLAPEMIECARRNAGSSGAVTFTVGDVANLPFPDATFDVIVSSLSQHHWTNPEGGLRDLRRVLRPGGRLWIYDARWALGRATVAARALFNPASVRREPLRTGRLPVRLIGRLSASTGVPVGPNSPG